MSIYISAMTQGILWSIMGIGLFISFRILRFADLTSEVAFTIGAATSVTAITHHVHPIVATLIAIIAGMIAGLITGILMTYFDIPSLLAGIITLTGLYSINLRIMGRANLSLRGFETVFDLWSTHANLQRFVVGIFCVMLCVVTLSFFFKTDLGQAMIATGDNEVMAHSLGISTSRMKCLALMLSNGMIGLSGAILAQSDGRADISMGAGTVIVGLASIIMGELFFRRQMKISGRLITIVIGAILYRTLLVFVLQLGFEPSDFKLISATLLAVFLALPGMKRRFNKLEREVIQ